MCLAVPARIVALDGDSATIELSGNSRVTDVSLIEQPAVGDWVLIHAGFAIEKLDPEDAAESLKLFAEISELDQHEIS